MGCADRPTFHLLTKAVTAAKDPAGVNTPATSLTQSTPKTEFNGDRRIVGQRQDRAGPPNSPEAASALPPPSWGRFIFNNSDQHPYRISRCPMRNRDFMSDGFLALVATGLLLLLSSLVAIALI